MPTKIRDSLWYTVGFTFLLTFVFVFGLAFLNSALSSRIELNTELFEKRAVLEAMGFSFDPKNVDQIEELYSKLNVSYYKREIVDSKETFVKVDPSGDPIISESPIVFYEADLNGEKVVGVSFEGSAMWGTIKGVISTDANVAKTVGIQIVSHGETPGLGARITSDTFRNQFYSGVTLKDGTVVLVKGNANGSQGEINAITGATVTSTSMNQMLERGYKDLKGILEVSHE